MATEYELYTGEYTGSQIDEAIAMVAELAECVPGLIDRIETVESKEFDPTSAQQAALDSGINSTKTAQIDKNQSGLAGAIDGGAKNIIQNNLISRTKNGVTATTNPDKSITLTGSSTSSSAMTMVYDLSDVSLGNNYSSKIPVKPGTYIMIGTGDSRVKIQAWGYTDSTDCDVYANSKDNAEFTVTTKPYISFRFYIAANADFTTPLTIYPMCCPKDSYAISPAYVPRVPSQAELSADFTDFSKYENPIAVEWTDGKYISSQGEIGTDANYSISSEIKMRKGQRIVFNATGGSATSILTKFVNGVPTRIFDGSIAVMRYTIPKKFWIADEDCVVRICHDIRANSSNRIIQNEDVKPTIYNDIQYLGNSPLWGKKLVVVGDSLVYGSRIGEYPTWANWLAAKYRMTLVNAGINGSSIAEIPEGADGDDLHDPIVDRYNALLQDNKDADYIVYEGGANDRTQGVPLGSVGSNAKTEFIGAITRIINGTRIIVPKAKIFFISLPWRWTSANTLGLTEADYANAMISACQAKGVLCRNPCFEVDVDFRDAAMAAWADEGIWLGETANRHYSPDGYQYILPAIEKFLNQ